MTTGLFSQDSTLKRHAESAAFFSQLARLETPPTDATLRRHYAQLKNSLQSGKATDTRPTVQAHEAVKATQQDTPEVEKRTGLFGFLGRLFGL